MIAAVVAVVTSISVPYQIDRDAQTREVRRICIDSVLELRTSIGTLAGRYAGQPPVPNTVTADWAEAVSSVEQVRVSCRAITLHQAGDVEAKRQLWHQLDTEQNRAERSSTPDTSAFTAILNWTTNAIEDLTSTS